MSKKAPKKNLTSRAKTHQSDLFRNLKSSKKNLNSSLDVPLIKENISAFPQPAFLVFKPTRLNLMEI